MKIPSDWTFRNTSVANEFDRHVREQLPWYDQVSGAAAHFARHYIPDRGLVYDVGASTGNMGRLLASALEARRATLVAIEASREMANKYHGPGKLVVADALEYKFKEFDVAICFLLMMFLPPARRKDWLLNLLGKCRLGGAIILVDLLENPGGYFGTACARLRLAGKMATGTSPGEIIAKELSLPGAQRPLPHNFVEFFVSAGAHRFFQFGEFAGWVIESQRH